MDALRAWQLAGADLSSVDYMGFSALQVVSAQVGGSLLQNKTTVEINHSLCLRSQALRKNSENVINFLARNELTNEVGSKVSQVLLKKKHSCSLVANIPGIVSCLE